MTVDLSTARPGCEVTFRCGGKAMIEEVVTKVPVNLMFAGFGDGATFGYGNNGNYFACRPHPLDIIAITAPPLTEAERLAEIAKEAKPFVHYLETYTQSWERDMVINTARAILALAEGSGR